jgi:hypothetical protein
MPEDLTLVQAARLVGVTPRILTAWLHDAGITTRNGQKDAGEDGRAQYITREQLAMLALAHKRVLPNEASLAALAGRIQTLEAELDSVKRRLARLEQGQNTTRERKATPAPLQSQPAPVSSLGADLADTLKRPRVLSSAALNKADAGRLVAARHGGNWKSFADWPWSAEALASEQAALRFALAYVAARAPHLRPHGWRWRCDVPGCPCQQQDQQG